MTTTTVMDDTTMLQRWKAGDAQAGQQLLRRHFRSLYGFFQNKCPDHADELVQATFTACIQTRDTFRGDASFRTFLFAIARRQLLAALRASHQAATRLDFELSSLADIVTTPSTRLARDQEHRRLVEALRQLPVEQQLVLELFYWHELDTIQLAVVFETTNAVIRQRLLRARRALRALLERDGSPADIWALTSARPEVAHA